MAKEDLTGISSNSLLQQLIYYLRSSTESVTAFLKQFCPSGSGLLLPIVGAVSVASVGAAIVYWTSWKSWKKDKRYLKIEPPMDLNKQTVEVSADRARVMSSIGSVENLKRCLYDDATTMYEIFRRGAKLSTTGECLGYRAPETTNGKKSDGPYKWLSYNDVIRRSENFARGLIQLGLQPGQNTFVGIYSVNRPEWIIAEQACYFYSMVIVPLYDTLGPDACSYIINHAEISLVIVDRCNKATELLQQYAQCNVLRTIVLMEAADSKLTSLAEQCGVKIIQFVDVEKIGYTNAENAPPAMLPTPDNLATISYTSGTTGPPKGVMLTHGNIVADLTSMSVLQYSALNSSDVLLSFLPLAHMFERVIEGCVFLAGARIGFYSGDIKKLPDDLKELRPTLLAVVPRVLNRTYDKVMQEVGDSRIKKFIIDLAVKAKVADLNRSIVRNDTFWDRYILKRVREGMGGRIRLMITGSAPLAPEILTFIRAATGAIVLEGYGQTECVAACTVGVEGDHIPGQVGPPVACSQIKLVDVPDMKYYAKDNVGEVCVKGYNVFQGYFKDEEKTAEALDSNGWLHTGDIGMWTSSGTLKLIDRKKHIFKLAQGEYIAPEKIENMYRSSKFVGQIFVHGESLKSCLIAIVSPDPEILVKYAADELKLKADMTELCKNEKIKKAILADMKAVGDKAGLQHFEQVKDIYLFPELFTIENGLLTPTLKTKRTAVKDYFKEQIDKMYEKLW